MTRFDYLAPKQTSRQRKKRRKAGKEARRARAHAADPPDVGTVIAPLDVVYVRRGAVRAVSRELRREGGQSVSDLVEDLLLAWLRARPR